MGAKFSKGDHVRFNNEYGSMKEGTIAAVDDRSDGVLDTAGVYYDIQDVDGNMHNNIEEKKVKSY